MLHILLSWIVFDPVSLIRTGGYASIALILFAESGVLVGIFLPGDSLLFAAGLLASSGILNIFILIILGTLAAILGDSIGYWFGAKVGLRLFAREDSLFFRKNYVERTQRFFDRYGARTIVVARFVPIVRTMAPILSGVGTMRYGRFLSYNMVGSILWITSVSLAGFFLGAAIPQSAHFVTLLSLIIVFVSLVPLLAHLFRHRRPPIITGDIA